MKEIQEKLKELNEKIGALDIDIRNVKGHIEALKEIKRDCSNWELMLNEFKEEKKKIEKQILILNEADNILLGL